VDLKRQAVIEDLLAAAETVVFLGFAYHDQTSCAPEAEEPTGEPARFRDAMGFGPADVRHTRRASDDVSVCEDGLCSAGYVRRVVQESPVGASKIVGA
jgi:hypothetical protein